MKKSCIFLSVDMSLIQQPEKASNKPPQPVSYGDINPTLEGKGCEGTYDK